MAEHETLAVALEALAVARDSMEVSLTALYNSGERLRVVFERDLKTLSNVAFAEGVIMAEAKVTSEDWQEIISGLGG